MSAVGKRTRRSRQRGASLIEFAFVALVLFTIIFGSFEIDRMLLAYTTLANSARIGARHAMVSGNHGNPGVPCEAEATSAVEELVKDYGQIGLLKRSNITVTVNMPSSCDPGATFSIAVSYPYDPWIIPGLGVTLQSSTTGVITY